MAKQEKSAAWRAHRQQLISVILLRVSCAFIFEAFVLGGCATTRPVENHIPVRIYAADTGHSDTLVIFLPGRGDGLDAFERAGFIDILHQSDPQVDSVVIDSHVGYYLDSSFPEKVYRDVLVPFQEQGYRHFFLVGISMGGYGALWINHEHGELISGMVLLAPYLGSETLIESIVASGGVHSWRSQFGHKPGNDELVWFWIDDLRQGGSEETGKVILAIGQRDRFKHAAQLLSISIPNTLTFNNGGGHNWKTWKSLWLEITKSQKWIDLGYTQ